MDPKELGLIENKFGKDGIEFIYFTKGKIHIGRATSGEPFNAVGVVSPKTIVDLGANVGIWSMYMAKKFPQAKIYAVEASGLTFQCLETGLKLNNIQNVVPMRLGISVCDPVKIIHEPGNPEASSEHLVENSGHSLSFCDGRTLNEFFVMNSFLFVDLLKIDIEGSEFQVLPDFRFWDRVGAIQIEVHSQFLKEEKGKKSVELKNLIVEKMAGKPVYIDIGNFA